MRSILLVVIVFSMSTNVTQIIPNGNNNNNNNNINNVIIIIFNISIAQISI